MPPKASPCPHTPSSPLCTDVPKYAFYGASWAGCLGCVKKLLEARPGLISEASDNQRYTGLTWVEPGFLVCPKQLFSLLPRPGGLKVSSEDFF